MIRRFLSPDLGKLKYKARSVKHQINLHHISDLHISLVFVMVKKLTIKTFLFYKTLVYIIRKAVSCLLSLNQIILMILIYVLYENYIVMLLQFDKLNNWSHIFLMF